MNIIVYSIFAVDIAVCGGDLVWWYSTAATACNTTADVTASNCNYYWGGACHSG